MSASLRLVFQVITRMMTTWLRHGNCTMSLRHYPSSALAPAFSLMPRNMTAKRLETPKPRNQKLLSPNKWTHNFYIACIGLRDICRRVRDAGNWLGPHVSSTLSPHHVNYTHSGSKRMRHCDTHSRRDALRRKRVAHEVDLLDTTLLETWTPHPLPPAPWRLLPRRKHPKLVSHACKYHVTKKNEVSLCNSIIITLCKSIFITKPPELLFVTVVMWLQFFLSQTAQLDSGEKIAATFKTKILCVRMQR